MTPTKQTKLYQADGHHSGNCWQACLASILDLPLWMVPDFSEMFGRTSDHYMSRTEAWLERMFNLKITRVEGHPIETLPEFYIASGLSQRFVQHAVIYSQGMLVHDPHWSDMGIVSVERCYYLEPIHQQVEGC